VESTWIPLPTSVQGQFAVIGILAKLEFPANDPTFEQLHELHSQLAAFRDEMRRQHPLDLVIGTHPATQKVRTQLQFATSSDMNVSIVAPDGCGREQIARSVFYNRPPLQGRLLPLSCDLLDTELLETSLSSFQSSRADFFTGEDVPDTLLFLDIDRLSHECQLLLDRQIRHGTWDYRVITTSAEDLEDIDFLPLVGGTFTTLTIRVPPLAERRQDVPLLAQHFLERLNRAGEQRSGFSRTALEHLQAYDWPGDLEQLSQVVQEACESARGTRVEAADLPKRIHWYLEDLTRPREQYEPIQLDEVLRSIEQRLVTRAMELSGGNKAQAARLLGITRMRVIRRVAEGGGGD
jgi:DNA-binding NtrC family response regulator